MSERLYLYPIWVRLWHLTNLLLFLLLICTGLCVHFAGPGTILIPFELSVSIHNVAGIILVAAYFVFIVGNMATRNGKFYKVKLKGLFGRLKKQFVYYTIGIFKKQDPPFPFSKERKFNPMQLFSYTVVMYIFMPLLLLSGLALFFPEHIPTQIFNKSGIHIVDLVHIISGFILSVFMLIHIYFCTMGAKVSSSFKSMINGWHESAA
jgi:thiosulfate reductase cytochrome b subunit